MFCNIKAVLFDLDGTLIDSMWLWKTIDIEYLSKYNLEFPKDLQSEIEGMSFTETAIYFKERFKLEDSIEDIKAEWNKMAEGYYKNQVTLKPYTIEILEYLKANEIKIGIGTSNSKELVETVLNRFNIKNYFDSIRTSCEVKQGKPAPDIYLKVAEDLEVNPENCLVFEDVPMGIKAGKSAGMKVCAVYDDFSKEFTDYIKKIADYYIESFEEIFSGQDYKTEKV